MSDPDEEELPVLMSQALLVTAGPFAGRICENDDDAFIHANELDEWEREWMEEAGLVWRTLTPDPDLAEEVDDAWWDEEGADFEIVTFGRYILCRGSYHIPRQFLRPATMKDLVQRHQEISESVFRRAWRTDDEELDDDDEDEQASRLLLEQLYIVDEIWRRESLARNPTGKKTLFLCHASEDKPFVRHVHGDLANAGHSAWVDEFEINVGDSIVDKINKASAEADALLLFISKGAMQSDWVKREWSSALSRSLSGGKVKILPLLIEDCERPALLSDIKYADFRESYNFGLDALLRALSN